VIEFYIILVRTRYVLKQDQQLKSILTLQERNFRITIQPFSFNNLHQETLKKLNSTLVSFFELGPLSIVCDQ